jgi:hypothetical protein
MAWRIEDYRTAAGETPVRSFIAGLSAEAKAEASALIKLAETLGNNLREPHSNSPWCNSCRPSFERRRRVTVRWTQDES